MRINEQRDCLRDHGSRAEIRIRSLIGSINKKMSMPYGDGSRSNMVNAETDVLPALHSILNDVSAGLDLIQFAD